MIPEQLFDTCPKLLNMLEQDNNKTITTDICESFKQAYIAESSHFSHAMIDD